MERLTPLGVIMRGLKNGTEVPWDDALIDPEEVKKMGRFKEEMDEQFGTEWHEDDLKPVWKEGEEEPESEPEGVGV